MVFIKENASENVVCTMAPLCSELDVFLKKDMFLMQQRVVSILP